MREKGNSNNHGLSLGIRKIPSQARIINGESINGAKYPFLAQVHLKVNDGKTEEWYDSGGSIVTNSIILTCGHCVCQGPEKGNQKQFVTCRRTKRDRKLNQNQKGTNEVYYSIGTQVFDEATATHLSKIKVYLFKNELFDNPDDLKYFSKNGDIAVIKDATMGVSKYKAGLIGLPTSFGVETFGDQNGLYVKIAGRGDRYVEWESKIITPPRILTSCTTNEGGIYGKRFLPCKDFHGPPPNKEFCASIPDDITSFPATTKISIQNGDVQFDPPPSTDVCDDYWKKAIKHIESQLTDNNGQGIFTLDEWKNRADRIVICDNKVCYDDEIKKTNIAKGEICYNVRKLGEFGICATDEQHPFNWGFCSKSCGLPQEMTDDKKSGAQFSNYEILSAKYFDIAPPNAKLFKSSNFTIKSIIKSSNFNLLRVMIFFLLKVIHRLL